MALIRCINWGGDADTVGCIAGSLLGALYGVDWLPQRWLKPLHDRPLIVKLVDNLLRQYDIPCVAVASDETKAKTEETETETEEE